MKAHEFRCWLRGWFELDTRPLDTVWLTADQVAKIKMHLGLVRDADPAHRDIFVAWLDMRLRGVHDLGTDATSELRRMLAVQAPESDRETIRPADDGGVLTRSLNEQVDRLDVIEDKVEVLDELLRRVEGKLDAQAAQMIRIEKSLRK